MNSLMHFIKMINRTITFTIRILCSKQLSIQTETSLIRKQTCIHLQRDPHLPFTQRRLFWSMVNHLHSNFGRPVLQQPEHGRFTLLQYSITTCLLQFRLLSSELKHLVFASEIFKGQIVHQTSVEFTRFIYFQVL
jgi:hypothetical protein